MKITGRGLRYWLPYYFWQQLISQKRINHKKTIHLIVCVVDHFEPFNSGVDYETAKRRVESWVDGFPKMAAKHRDADGRPPQHSWFYPPHNDHIFLKDLVGLCRAGYGEIEMHLHHNHMEPFPDTAETLKLKILKCIEDYGKYDIFGLPSGSSRFAFIHGDWSLDNALGDEICGINNEITILKDCGCYADFTFPSLGKAQPNMVNTIFYAKDNPCSPKSYSRGVPVSFGGKAYGDLMMVQGIIGLRWESRTHKFRPSVEASNLDRRDFPSPGRVEYWVRNGVKIKGKEEWIFIKLHTHGCREVDFDCLFGCYANNMHSYLENRFNDGKRYALHYVTAREMFNIIKAAEAGVEGDPNDYRNYEIERYIYLD